jgi:hypothetical protein
MNEWTQAWAEPRGASSSRQNQAPVSSMRLFVMKPIIGEHLEQCEDCSVRWDALEAYPDFQNFLEGIPLSDTVAPVPYVHEFTKNSRSGRQTIYRIIGTAQLGERKIYVALVLPPNETPIKVNDSTKVRLTVFVLSQYDRDDPLMSNAYVFGFPNDVVRDHFLHNVPW